MSKATSGKNNPGYKGNVVKLNIVLYDTYGEQIKIFEEVYIYELFVDGIAYKTFKVKCHYCKEQFLPTRTQVINRISAFNGFIQGEHNFYCSEKCKHACSTYGQIKYPKGFKNHKNDRPGQKQWRKMVLERDDNTCQICGFHSPDGKGLVAHHMLPVIQNPVESMDIDIGVTLCIPCDNMVHQLPGCKPHELKCKKPKT